VGSAVCAGLEVPRTAQAWAPSFTSACSAQPPIALFLPVSARLVHHHCMATSPAAPPALVDGRLVPAAEARISLADPAFTHGDGLFETIRLLARRPVGIDAHLSRLCGSAEALRIPCPSPAAWRGLVTRLLAAAPELPEAALRLQLCAPRPDAPESLGTTALTLRPLGAREAVRRAGLALWTVPWARAPRGGLGGHKLVAWAATPIAARTHPNGRDADFEAVFTDGEALLEGGTTSLALLIGDRLQLPPLDGRLLASVTRARLVDGLAGRLGLSVTVSPVTREAALAADAVLALSALLPATPATSLDGSPLRLTQLGADTLAVIREALSEPPSAG
jgi:branched-subunit amino acid aminotransferase/4-amino-4-deoxychorismate lyase